MADLKISQLTAITTLTPATDVLPVVDVTGTTKKITTNQILGAGGTATLASATITGDLTVNTNVLKVDSTNDRVGIGTASPAAPFDVRSNGNSAGLFLRTTDPAAAVSSAYIQAPVSTGFSSTVPIYGFWYQNSGMGNPANDTLSWIIASGEIMRLNSTGLCVGGSPQAKFHAIDSSGACALFTRAAAPTAALSAVYIQAPVSSGFSSNPVLNFWYQNAGISNPANECFAIRTSSADRMYFDDVGNVGVGVTPSAWRSGARAIQSGANGYAAFWEQASGYVNLSFGVYEGSANVFNYKTTGDAPTTYKQGAGTHEWYNAASGTAGGTVTFSRVMAVDANGNLILKSSNTPATLANNGELTVNATSNTNLRFSYRGSDGTTRTADITLA
jgi:hypothetical protein